MPKVTSFEDKQYSNSQSKRAFFDCLAQAFQDLKLEKYSQKSWNVPVEQLKGITMKLMNDHEFCLTYHRVEAGTVEEMAAKKEDGGKFLSKVLQELKKRVKKLHGKTLKTKKIKEDRSIENFTRVHTDVSWQVGAAPLHYHSRPQRKFFVKDTAIYSIDVEFDE